MSVVRVSGPVTVQKWLPLVDSGLPVFGGFRCSLDWWWFASGMWLGEYLWSGGGLCNCLGCQWSAHGVWGNWQYMAWKMLKYWSKVECLRTWSLVGQWSYHINNGWYRLGVSLVCGWLFQEVDFPSNIPVEQFICFQSTFQVRNSR